MKNPFIVPEPRAVLDVAGAHLDEAAFAYEVWERELHSPSMTLGELSGGPEARLFANLDGLILGADTTAASVLVPQLLAPEDPERTRCVASAMALLGQRRSDVVFRALQSEVPEVAFGARRALALAPDAAVDALISERLAASCDVLEGRSLLAVCAMRGIAIQGLLGPLHSADEGELSDALVAMRHSRAEAHVSAVEHLLSHPVPRVRDEALITALIFRSPAALDTCVERGSDTSRADPLAMILLALLGSSPHHRTLIEHLDRPSHRYDALFAIGFTGNSDCVPALLERMASSDRRESRLSSEAFACITGLPTGARGYSVDDSSVDEDFPALEDDDLDADLVPPEEEKLRLPNASAVSGWWLTNGARISSKARLLGGEPWSMERVVDYLETAPMRRRHALGLWMTIATAGMASVDTLAFSAKQRAQLSACKQFVDGRRAQT